MSRSGAEIFRVGPSGSLASDSQFGVSLTTLWHAVSTAGGAVGFAADVGRPEVAAGAAAIVGDLKAGRAHGLAAVAGGELVGYVQLTPGVGLVAHTGGITALMVDPAQQRSGLGSRLLAGAMELGSSLGLERVTLSVRDGENLQPFYSRFGFTEWGRRPGWVRVADGDDRDEVFLWAALNA